MGRLLLLSCAFSLAAARVTSAQPQASRDWGVVTTSHLRSDARLATPVSVLGPRLFVAEVLAALSEQTGVVISPHEPTDAGDARLIAWVKGEPAWKVMSALAALFSHKHAPWQWERSGSSRNWEYRLVQTRSARELAERLEREAQSAFEVATIADIAATRRTDEEWAERLADSTPVRIEERAGWGLQVFATCLDPELQQAVLRGQRKVTVPVEELPPFGRRLVEDLYREMQPYRILPNGDRETPPMPTQVQFYTHTSGLPTASLYIRLGYLGAYGYSGGLPLARSFRSHMRDLWAGSTDRVGDEAREAMRVPNGAVSKETSRLNSLERCCMQLAELTDIPILARTPRSHGTGTERSPANHVLGEYLDSLAKAYHAMHKWHEGFLLISYASWFQLLEELHRPPYAVVRRLREAAAGNDGLLTPEAILDACQHLTPEQMLVLEDSVPGFKWLVRVRAVMTYVATDDDLRTKLVRDGRVVLRGPVLTSLLPTMDEAPAPGRTPEHLPVDTVDRLVVRLRERTEDQARYLDAQVWLYDTGGKFIMGLGATFTPGTP